MKFFLCYILFTYYFQQYQCDDPLFKKYPAEYLEFLNDSPNGSVRYLNNSRVLELRGDDRYDVIVTSSSEREESETISYQCMKPKRYCSDNPNYCEYEEGDDDTNIIVSVPHGGTHKPDDIPDRVAGCYINDTCIYTHDCVNITNGTRRDNIKCSYFSQQDFMAKNTSLKLTRQIELVTGKRSHFIVSNLHRTKLDVNREIHEAALGIKEAEIVWKSFHSFIKLAKQKLNRKPGIIFDIHTQSHSAASLEIGYAIPSNKLNKNILHMENSSIYSLGKRLQNRTNFEELIYGNISLGRFTEDMGIETIPSPRKRSPGDLSYFPGGYIIRKHGSKNRGKVDAIQLESSSQSQRAENFQNYTTLLAKAVVKFVKLNYESNGEKKN